MTNELAPNLRCVAMRNGVEFWITTDKAERLAEILGTMTEHKFVTISGTFGEKTINTADVTGIFTPQDMEETKRRKNGEWKCQHGYWHNRREQCNHKVEVYKPAVEPEKPRTPQEQARVKKNLDNLRAQKDQLLGKRSMP